MNEEERVKRNQTIILKFSEGSSVKELASEFSVSESWIRQLLSREGIFKKRFRTEQEYYDAWYRAGCPKVSVKELISVLKIGQKEFYKYFRNADNFFLLAEKREEIGLGKSWKFREGPLDKAILFLYIEQNLGLVAISKILDKGTSFISYRLKKNSVKLREGFKDLGKGGRSRPKEKEFSNKVKRTVYLKQEGICGVCGKPVPWYESSFHHIKPICQGGDGSEENCLLVHPSCHKEKFEELHGFITEKYGLKNKVDIKFYKELLKQKNLL